MLLVMDMDTETQQFREVLNPPNPWQEHRVEWLEEIPVQKVKLYKDSSRSVLSMNDSPDLPFKWSVNPYRGCTHACAYCYARSSHEYLGLGAGRDFESLLFVKENAAELLREEMAKPSWTGERVVFSGVTDPYQPVEASLKITRACLEVCEEVSNPVTIITKGALVERDLDLLKRIHEREDVLLIVSIPFLHGETARGIEPGVPSPRRRFEVIRRATQFNIPVAVAISPIIPGLNDMEVAGILREARRAGARHAMHSLVRLQGSVDTVFRQRLRERFPGRKKRILSQMSACRDGKESQQRFHERMKGKGERWEIVSQLFQKVWRDEGYVDWSGPDRATSFRRPGKNGQLHLL